MADNWIDSLTPDELAQHAELVKDVIRAIERYYRDDEGSLYSEVMMERGSQIDRTLDALQAAVKASRKNLTDHDWSSSENCSRCGLAQAAWFGGKCTGEIEIGPFGDQQEKR